MNRVQKRQLQAYLHFRAKRMSVLALFRFNWRMLLILVIAGAATVGYMLYNDDHFLASVFAAAYFAVLVRDFGQCLRWSRTWEMNRQLLDWSKIERLASENGVAF